MNETSLTGLQAQGSKLCDRASGENIRLMGFNLQDPLWQRIAPGPRLLPHGPINLELAKSFGANAVRVPFHPVTIRAAGNQDWDTGLLAVRQELDWILLAAHALNLKVIVDFHSIGFPAEENYFEFDEEPFENLYETSQYEIESFWRTIARDYGQNSGRASSIAAFELFNETTKDAKFGSLKDWDTHATWIESLLSGIIRPLAPDMLAIVSGLHFGYDLEAALDRPVRDPNIAYASHPYPHHSQAKQWDQAFGRLARQKPVLLTEIGFSSEGFFGRQHHRGFRDWELEIRSYADRLGLSFFAWNLSAHWEPTLLNASSSGPYSLNEAGEFFRQWIQSGIKTQTGAATFSSVPTSSFE